MTQDLADDRRAGTRLARLGATPLPVLLGLLALLFYLPTAGQDIDTVDVAAVDVGSWVIATTGNPWVDDVEDEQVPYPGGMQSLFTTTNESNGHGVIARSTGTMLVGVPGYAIAAALDPDTREELSPRPGGLTAAVLAAVAIGLFAASLGGLVGRRTIAAAVGALALTTPFWSLLGGDLWPHTLTALGLAGMCWGCRTERWWLVGLFGGIGLLGRLHLSLVVAVVGLVMAWHHRDPRIALRVAGGSVPFLALSSLLSHWHYGTWSPNGAYAAGDLAGYASTQSAADFLMSVAGVLVSPGIGIFVWTPVLLLMLPAVVRSWRDVPAWPKAMLAGATLYLLVQLRFNPFHGGTGFWGYRISIELVVAAFPLVALSAPRMGRWARRAVTPVLGLQLGLIALGAVFGICIVDARSWRSNIFLTVGAAGPVVMAAFVLAGIAVAYCVRGILGTTTPTTPTAQDPQPVGRT